LNPRANGWESRKIAFGDYRIATKFGAPDSRTVEGKQAAVLLNLLEKNGARDGGDGRMGREPLGRIRIDSDIDGRPAVRERAIAHPLSHHI